MDIQIAPKISSKIGPKTTSRSIPARRRLQRRFLSRLRRLQARFQGLREVDFVYLIAKQRTSLSYLQATVVAIMQTTERAVTAIAVALPWDHLLRWLHSDKAYLRHKFQRCQFGTFLANASCLGSYSERIYDKFSVSISIRLYSTWMLRIILLKYGYELQTSPSVHSHRSYAGNRMVLHPSTAARAVPFCNP